MFDCLGREAVQPERATRFLRVSASKDHSALSDRTDEARSITRLPSTNTARIMSSLSGSSESKWDGYILELETNLANIGRMKSGEPCAKAPSGAVLNNGVS